MFFCHSDETRLTTNKYWLFNTKRLTRYVLSHPCSDLLTPKCCHCWRWPGGSCDCSFIAKGHIVNVCVHRLGFSVAGWEAHTPSARKAKGCNSQVVAYSGKSKDGRTVTIQNGGKYDGFKSCMCRRTDLHDELKRLTLEEDGPGAPVQLHLSTQIVDCDPEAGILTSKSDEKYEADVIIAADGVNVCPGFLDFLRVLTEPVVDTSSHRTGLSSTSPAVGNLSLPLGDRSIKVRRP
ncbi:hypothetical protein C8J57DRAFT_1249156 [Mycena rebaudengoi]|nr:hypothetical protein C8J57DRAFT_1249156 [Mycena rebaudengoi]